MIAVVNRCSSITRGLIENEWETFVELFVVEEANKLLHKQITIFFYYCQLGQSKELKIGQIRLSTMCNRGHFARNTVPISQAIFVLLN